MGTTNYVVSAGDTWTYYPPFDIYSGDPIGAGGCGNTFRGMFGDCSCGATTGIADCTDGTSNTFMIGENSPNQNGALTLYNGDATYAITTIPLNWSTKYKDGQVEPNGDLCDVNHLSGYTSIHCFRNESFNGGFKSYHPGGANFGWSMDRFASSNSRSVGSCTVRYPQGAREKSSRRTVTRIVSRGVFVHVSKGDLPWMRTGNGHELRDSTSLSPDDPRLCPFRLRAG